MSSQITPSKVPPEPPKLPSNRQRRDGGEPAAKAQFFKAAAKLVGIAGVSLVPATVGWLDARTEAIEAEARASTALKAAATEKSRNDQAYEKLAERLEELEDMAVEIGEAAEELDEALSDQALNLARHDGILHTLARRAGVRPRREPEPANRPLIIPEDNPLSAFIKKKKSAAPRSKKRPEAKDASVEQIQQQYLKGNF